MLPDLRKEYYDDSNLFDHLPTRYSTLDGEISEYELDDIGYTSYPVSMRFEL